MHEVDLTVLAEEELLAQSAGVGVLVHEPLPGTVDEDAAHQAAWWCQRDAHLDALHAERGRADPFAHADGPAVVEGCADRHVAAQRVGAVLAHHLLVEDEASCGEHHASAGAHETGRAVGRGLDPDDPAVVHHEPIDDRVGDHPRRRLVDRVEQPLHEEAAGGVGELRMVTPWHRVGDGVERPRVLAAAEHQPRVVGRLPAGLGMELRPERHAVVDQPVEVAHAVVAVRVHLGLVDLGTARREQEAFHVLGRVGVAALLLHGCSATQVDEPARHSGSATAHGGRFEHDDVDAHLGGLDGGARTRTSEAHDHHVGVVVPHRHVAGIDRFDHAGGPYRRTWGRLRQRCRRTARHFPRDRADDGDSAHRRRARFGHRQR